MFKTSFCAVPDFIRVLPVTNSGPTIGVIANCAVFAKSESGLHEIPAVKIPFCFAFSRPPIT